jgi:hypothetical protein
MLRLIIVCTRLFGIRTILVYTRPRLPSITEEGISHDQKASVRHILPLIPEAFVGAEEGYTCVLVEYLRSIVCGQAS